MKVPGVDHILFLEPAVADLELRHRRFRGRAPKLELAAIELDVARNGAALPVRADLDRARHSRGDVVAVEQQGLVRVERQVERGASAMEGRVAGPLDRPSARGPPRHLGEDQLRPGEMRLSRDLVDNHSGGRALQPCILGAQRAPDLRIGQASADVGADRDRTRQVEHLAAR